MHGITIIYDFDGDEQAWEAAIGEFIASIDADRDVAGKFQYRVSKAKEGNRRIHWGWWNDPATVQTLQSRDYFRVFSQQVKTFAGDSLVAMPLTGHATTAS